MSLADATLIIGYSRPEIEAVFVKQTFDTIFGTGFVEYVIEKVFTPTGRPQYKKFYLFVHDQDHPDLKRMTDIIDEFKYAAIVYKNEWDWKACEYVKRYWKVFAAPVRPKFHPYLMSKAEMSDTYIEPWCAEADVAFEPPKPTYTHIDTESEEEERESERERIVLPPPMVRDNGGPFPLVRSVNSPPEPIQDKAEEESDEDYWLKHGPCKLTRMSNECLSVQTDDESDTSQDFDDLAEAIETFGEDYPGSIAPKIPRPPPLVRSETIQLGARPIAEEYKFNSCNY
jgi:hypothetical protein